MRKASWVVFLVCLFINVPLIAQKVTGTITGSVTDPSGAAISGAAVSVKNTATGEVRTVTSNSSGGYVLTDLPAGTYDIDIKQPSFKEYVSKGVQLFVASTTTLNATLQVGSATEQVTVEANTVQVETSTGTVGNVIEGNEVKELPLNGRSFAQLTQLMPGVSPASNFSSCADRWFGTGPGGKSSRSCCPIATSQGMCAGTYGLFALRVSACMGYSSNQGGPNLTKSLASRQNSIASARKLKQIDATSVMTARSSHMGSLPLPGPATTRIPLSGSRRAHKKHPARIIAVRLLCWRVGFLDY